MCELSDVPPSYFLCDEIRTPAPAVAPISVLVKVKLGYTPEYFTWFIYNGNGEIVAHAPSYAEPGAEKTEVVTLNKGESYDFVVSKLANDNCTYLHFCTIYVPCITSPHKTDAQCLRLSVHSFFSGSPKTTTASLLLLAAIL